MDAALITYWPDEPYRECDFYTTRDAALFRERFTEVEDCVQLFTQYHTKVLLLHGSTGAGKSSFLRAGLIPALQRVEDPPGYAFMEDDDGVIRCTDDPVRMIARRMLGTIDAARQRLLARSRQVPKLREAESLLSEDAMASASSAALVAPLLNSLNLLRRMMGKTLVLVVDQAEEVLTHPRGEECTEAFFQLIEEIYLRDFDVRLIISLRTEYYGRFRNHLRIQDRYRALPSDGGLELYLLEPLRDREVLIQALDWPAANGQHDYGFKFAPDVLRFIVDDALAFLPNAAVTPALQVVCATLTRDRDPGELLVVTVEHYQSLGRIGRILDRFIDHSVTAATRSTQPLRSLRSAMGMTDSPTDRWRSTLMTMVSEQSGGVVVAIPRSEADLARAARAQGLTEPVGPALRAMAEGRGGILRLMGTEDEPAYILKHDTLALRLSRWHQQQIGVRRLRRKAAIAGGVGVAVFAVIGTALLITSFSSLYAHDASIRLRNNFAEHEAGNRSLMVLLANLAETRQRYNLADYLWPSPVHEESIEALRRTLLRAPWFHDRFAAAGMSPDGTELALLALENNQMQILHFPEGAVDEVPQDHLRPLHMPAAASDRSNSATESARTARMPSPPAAGFVIGLGPTAVRDGQAYYWDGETVVTRDLTGRLPNDDGSLIRYEIVGGAINATRRTPGIRSRQTQFVRFDRALLESGQPAPAPTLVSTPPFQPTPLFDNTSSIGRYASYSDRADNGRDATDSAPEPAVQIGEFSVELHQPGGDLRIPFSNIPLIRKQHEQTRGRLTLAFSTGDETTFAVKPSGRSFYLRDWSSTPGELGRLKDGVRKITLVGENVGTDEDNRLLPAQWPFLNPLFAVARIEHGWRAAWMVGNGIQAVETDDDFDRTSANGANARQILSDVLMSNPTGARLSFSKGGHFLVLEENGGDWRTVDVKIWDLGLPWRNMIMDPGTDEAKLIKITCRAIGNTGSSGPDRLKLFDISPQFARPCGEAS